MIKRSLILSTVFLFGCQTPSMPFVGGMQQASALPTLKLEGRTPEPVYSEQQFNQHNLTLTRKGELILSQNGESVWSQKLPGFAFSKPVITQNQILVHTADGSLSLINAKGELVWRITRPSGTLIAENGLSPVVQDNVIYAGFSAGKIMAISANEGKIIWEGASGKVGFSDIARMNDIVHLVVGASEVVAATASGHVHAFHKSAGQKLWEQSFATVAKIAEIGGDYVVTVRDEIVKIDGSRGDILWRQEGEKLSTAAIKIGHNIAVGTEKGQVLLLHPRDGRVVESLKGPRDIAQLTIDNNALVAKDSRGASRMVT